MAVVNYLLRGVGKDGGSVRFVLSSDTVVVGRQGDVKLHHESVSRRHAVLERRDENWFLTDLDSSNGTFVNRASVQRHTLSNGDDIPLVAFLAPTVAVIGVTVHMARLSDGFRTTVEVDEALPSDGDRCRVHFFRRWRATSCFAHLRRGHRRLQELLDGGRWTEKANPVAERIS